jgi:hypothetical protein
VLSQEVSAETRPFGPAAFEEARKAGRAVALMLAPGMCPRCRSLEAGALDPDVAAVLDHRFVAVTLDPDERPDVARSLSDSLLLMPEPRSPQDIGLDPCLPAIIVTTPELRVLDGTGLLRGGRPLGPGLLPFLVGLADEWQLRRGEAETRAGLVAAALRDAQGATPPLPALSASLLERPLAGLREAFDRQHGGFGLPPRRVPHGALLFLLEEYARSGDKEALRLATATLDAVLAGGLQDPRGGFFREALGADWSEPVKEKTLADNALLLGALVQAHEATGRSSYSEAAQGLASWLRSDLADPGGGFRNAAADTASGEGQDPRVFAYANGLALSGLARSGRALGRKADIEAAATAAGILLARLGPPRSLSRWALGGESHGPSFLEDYAFLAQGLLDLHEATGVVAWRDAARDLLDELRVARRPEPHVVREHDGAHDVVVPVDRVDAVEQRDLEPRLRRLRVVAVDHLAPVGERVGLLGVGVASRQQRAQVIGRDVGRGGEEHLVGLGHLADLLVERHLRDERVDLLLVGEQRTLAGRDGAGLRGAGVDQQGHGEHERDQEGGRAGNLHAALYHD